MNDKNVPSILKNAIMDTSLTSNDNFYDTCHVYSVPINEFITYIEQKLLAKLAFLCVDIIAQECYMCPKLSSI